MSTTSSRLRVLVLVVLGALMLAACSSQGDADPGRGSGDRETVDEFGRPIPEITVPPDDVGDFFTWEQDREYTGEEAQVVATGRAYNYYMALSSRYGGYVAPQWPSIASPEFAKVLNDRDRGNEWLTRGPARNRLVQVSVNGRQASSVICDDASRSEGRPTPDSNWTSHTDSPVTVLADRYIRSEKSPTGWIVSGYVPTTTTARQCQALLDKPAPVKQTGPFTVPGS